MLHTQAEPLSEPHQASQVWSKPPRGHGPDLRRFAVAVWRLICNERDLNVDRARLRLEGNLQLQAVEQRPELRLGQVLKTLGEKRQAVERGGEIGDGRRSLGHLGGERVRVLPPFFQNLLQFGDPGL